MTTIGSLFSGYGGLDIAVQATLGGEVAWHCDIDPAAARLLAHRHPDIPNLGDITTVDWARIAPVDVLTGGFPCQDVSAAGRRAGMTPDSRSGLWTHMARAVNVLRPQLVVIENVRGLLNADAACDVEPCPWCLGDHEGRPLRALGAVLGDLAVLRYDAGWVGLQAADVGAPHGRYRVFVTAWPAGSDPAELGRRAARRDDRVWAAGLVAGATAGDSQNVELERRGPVHRVGAGDTGPVGGPGRPATEDPHGAASDQRGFAAPGQAPGGRARSDAGRPGRAPAADASGGELQRRGVGGVLAGPEGSGAGEGPQRQRDRDASRHGSEDASDAPGVGRREGRPEPARVERGPDAAVGGVAPAADAVCDGREGRPERDLGAEAGQPASRGGDAAGRVLDWGDYAPAIQRWERVLGRPAPAPTQTGKRGGQQLSPAFVEWLMGLPAGHVTDLPGLSRNDQLKILGNGVVPQQAELALRHLLTAAACPERAA